MYIENALPPVEMLRKKNANIVIGTDSLSSNVSLQMLDELKMLQQHFPLLSLHEILSWATLNGAKALGVDARFGSFEVGKQPGVVLLEKLDLQQQRLIPETTSTRVL
jgi:cytosine/adenosine deaminase-related metal-dependent hydrolase